MVSDLSSSLLAASFQYKVEDIEERHLENFKNLFPDGVGLKDACTEVPNNEGRNDTSKQGPHLQAWIMEFARKKNKEEYWFMRTPSLKLLKPSKHRYHKNSIQWLVSFQSLLNNWKYVDQDSLIDLSAGSCLQSLPDSILPVEDLFKLFGQELSYFLGFYDFPQDLRAQCGRGIRPSVDLLSTAILEINKYMPSKMKVGLNFYKKDRYSKPLKEGIKILPVKIQESDLMRDDPFLFSYDYLYRFVYRGELPMEAHGYFYSHDYTNHLGALLYHPKFLDGQRELVRTALEALLEIPLDSEFSLSVISKSVRTLVDYVDSLTTGNGSLVEIMNKVIKSETRKLWQNDETNPPSTNKVPAYGKIFEASYYEDVGRFFAEVYKDIDYTKRSKYAKRVKRVCTELPCPARDLLIVALAENSNYPHLDMSKEEADFYSNFLKFKVSTDVLKQPRLLKDWYANGRLNMGRKQFAFFQQMDIALKKWKEAKSVDFIHPGGSADI